MSTKKELPSHLDPKGYPLVCFWTIKSYEAHCKNLAGETDGLATQQRRCGPRPKSESHTDCYPYLENKDGSAVSWDILVKVGQKARRLWQSMDAANMSPSSWGKASESAYNYFNIEMLSEPKFEFFRYCESNWKITRWTTKAYASWSRNRNETNEHKPPHANK